MGHDLQRGKEPVAAAAACALQLGFKPPQGAAVADYEDDTKLHGFRQDFLIAADRPTN